MGRYIIIKHHPSPTPPYQLFIALNPYNILEYNKCVYIYYTYPYGFGLNPILPTCFIEKKLTFIVVIHTTKITLVLGVQNQLQVAMA